MVCSAAGGVSTLREGSHVESNILSSSSLKASSRALRGVMGSMGGALGGGGGGEGLVGGGGTCGGVGGGDASSSGGGEEDGRMGEWSSGMAIECGPVFAPEIFSGLLVLSMVSSSRIILRVSMAYTSSSSSSSFSSSSSSSLDSSFPGR